MGARLLVVVAPETTETQVGEIARTTQGFGDDVVNGELVAGEVHQRAAVFTADSAPAGVHAGAVLATTGSCALHRGGAPEHDLIARPQQGFQLTLLGAREASGVAARQ